MAKMSKHLALTLAASLALAVSSAKAVSTSHWIAGNETDFKAGSMHDVVVTNLGDLKLSRAIKALAEQDPNVTSVNAMAEAPDGTVYAGTGPKGILLAIRDGKVTKVATIDDAVSILSVMVDSKGAVLIGTGGEKGRILKIDKPGDKPKEIFSADGVQYIWSMVQTADGNVYAATGPNGQIFEIKPDGSHSVLYKSGENNFISLLSDKGKFLYAGSDPDGLIVRIDRTNGKSFVVYNAGESEITALAMDEQGDLFAATGQAGERQGQQQGGESTTKSGRPETKDSGAPSIPAPVSPPPEKPPVKPAPSPGQPKPIPRKTQSRVLPIDQPTMMDALSGTISTSRTLLTSAATQHGETPARADDDAPAGKTVAGQGEDGPGDDAPGDDGPGENGPMVGPGPMGGGETGPQDMRVDGGGQGENPGENHPEGNAIYKIDKDGFVNEIFRQNVVIYSMIEQNDVLLVGTGSDGNVYQVNPATEETVVLAKVDAKQVLALLPTKNGQILMGLANTGGLAEMSGGFAGDGNYTSPVLDATQVSRFGKINLHGLLPDHSTLKVSTRSGNVKDANAPGWSPWTKEFPATEYVSNTSPSARFLQYRLTFGTTDPTKTAIVDHVDVAYQIPNLAPIVKAIKVGNESSGGPGPQGPQMQGPGMPGGQAKPQGTGVQAIAWEAADPNNDTLTYSLYYRLENRGPWITLKEKIKEPAIEWDTRPLPNGRYQVKVVASDAASNPPGTGKTTSRVSDYFTVANTQPTISDVNWKQAGKDVKLDINVHAGKATVANVQYVVDGSDDWQGVLPVDNIYDDPDESVSINLTGLTAGSHQVTIRATDSQGNQAVQTIMIKIVGGGDAAK